jgi:hypothetical protein
LDTEAHAGVSAIAVRFVLDRSRTDEAVEPMRQHVRRRVNMMIHDHIAEQNRR